MLSATASWAELSTTQIPATNELTGLTPAERFVAIHLREGLSNKELACLLGKSETTVKNQVASILRKLGVPNRGRLIAALYQSQPPTCHHSQS
jgi:DNA-binding CsgD family transcriptional regulator